MEQSPNSPLRYNHPEHWYFGNDDGNDYNTVSTEYMFAMQQTFPMQQTNHVQLAIKLRQMGCLIFGIIIGMILEQVSVMVDDITKGFIRVDCLDGSDGTYPDLSNHAQLVIM